ncbi:Metallo-beta-lactamase [Arabidopsis thaliana x Arabidopsis arenosa]|uniref:Metallo-beta-lactamase n=1 Tax=Arabidopsis thaliana x Arabidopsis arenosa TaxID=1240361 RepID=A0A8T2BI51_9BRAS|nr:Metallo-beta-lactamase [Arabidopsis thaliana x Arabidopsis arenosa]
MEKKKAMQIEGYPIEGLSIGGHETCIIFPSLRIAFDIGRCPHRAISQDFLFISHSHMDHIGGLPMYVATRGLYKMKPPTIIVPKSIKETVESLFEVHRKLDSSELKHNLVGLDIGEEFIIRKDLKVKAFKTYHVIQSQGYVVYSTKHKLKQEYIGLSGNEIKNLKASGVEITDSITTPEVAFTGDTTADFVVDESNADALKAKVLVMESTFLDDSVSVEHARDYGHIHLSEVRILLSLKSLVTLCLDAHKRFPIFPSHLTLKLQIVNHAEKFENKAILLIHFSARYTVKEIEDAVSALPPTLEGRVFALTQGF